MGNRDRVFSLRRPPLPIQVFELASQRRICSPLGNINTRAPGGSNGSLEDETEAEMAELVPEVAEEERPRAVTPAGVAGDCWLLWLGLLPRGKRRQRKKHVRSRKSSWVGQTAAAQAGKTAGQEAENRGHARKRRKPCP